MGYIFEESVMEFKENHEYVIEGKRKIKIDGGRVREGQSSSHRIYYVGNGLYKNVGEMDVCQPISLDEFISEMTDVVIHYPYSGNDIAHMAYDLTRVIASYQKEVDWDDVKQRAADYAVKIKSKGYILFGAGKLDLHHYQLLEWILHGINEHVQCHRYQSKFHYSVGQHVTLQNGDKCKIIARHMLLEGYETIVLDDLICRYDRSTSNHIRDTGRVTGTNSQYLDPRNIRKEELYQCYIAARAFARKNELDYEKMIKQVFNTVCFRAHGRCYPKLDTELMKAIGIKESEME